MSWLDKRVWHRTAGGKENFVKIGSLSPEERERYDYIRRREQVNDKLADDGVDPDGTDPDGVYDALPPSLDLYVAFKRSGSVSTLERSDLLMATNDPLYAIQLRDDIGEVFMVHNIPLSSVVKWSDIDSDGWNVGLPGDDPDLQLDKLEKTGEKKFILRLYNYRDALYVEGADDEEDSND